MDGGEALIVNVRMLGRLLFAAYMAVLFYITLVAWNYGSSFEPSELAGRNYNYIPFRSIYRIGFLALQFVIPFLYLAGTYYCLSHLGVCCLCQFGAADK